MSKTPVLALTVGDPVGIGPEITVRTLAEHAGDPGHHGIAVGDAVAARRAAEFSSAMRAPVPAALPAEVTFARSQSGIMPSTIACLGEICAPKAPASTTRSTLSTPSWSISRRAPA